MNIYNNINIYPFYTSMKDKYFLLSYNGQYYEATYPIVELLTELQKYSTKEEAVFSYIQKKEGKYTSDQIQLVIEKFITPLFSMKKKKNTFLYEKILFTAPVIKKLSVFVQKNKYSCNTYSHTIIKYLFLFNNRQSTNFQ